MYRRQATAGVQAGHTSGSEQHAATTARAHDPLPAVAEGRAFFRWSETVRSVAVDRRSARARDQLWHLQGAVRAAADITQVGAWIHRQLGLVDHRSHDHHQSPVLPAATQESGVDAEDAGPTAAVESDSGSLLGAQDDGYRAPEDADRDNGAG